MSERRARQYVSFICMNWDGPNDYQAHLLLPDRRALFDCWDVLFEGAKRAGIRRGTAEIAMMIDPHTDS